MLRLLKIVGYTLGGILIFSLLMGPQILAAPATLLLGWLPSFTRLINAWHPAPSAVVSFISAGIALVAGSHAFLNWLYPRMRAGESSASPPNWPWKWTLCGLGMIFCGLLAICSLVLTTHQLFWISRSSDPLFTDPFRERIEMLRTAVRLQQAAQAAEWNSVETREAFWNGSTTSAGKPAAEFFQPVWIARDEHQLRAIILIPRRPMHRARAKLTVVQPGADQVTKSLDELPQVLASFGIGGASERAPGKPTLLP